MELFDAHHFEEAAESAVKVRGQGRGRITGLTNGKTGHEVNASHNNRAGHRLYVKVMQSRQVRKNIVGFGRWRSPIRQMEYLHDFPFVGHVQQAPRAERRPGMVAAAKVERNIRRRGQQRTLRSVIRQALGR